MLLAGGRAQTRYVGKGRGPDLTSFVRAFPERLTGAFPLPRPS